MSAAPFTLIRYEEIEAKPDGTPRRNRWAVMVQESDATHRVLIRRTTNRIHIPLPLRSSPNVRAITRAVRELMAPVIKEAKTERQRLSQLHDVHLLITAPSPKGVNQI